MAAWSDRGAARSPASDSDPEDGEARWRAQVAESRRIESVTRRFLEAVERGWWPEASAFLQAGADVNGLNDDEMCAIELAITQKHPGLVEHLLAAGAHPNGPQGPNNAFARGMPLHAASKALLPEIIARLLAAGADVNHKQARPLKAACAGCTAADKDVQALRLLLWAGARVDRDAALALLRNHSAPPVALALLVAHGLDLSVRPDELLQLAALNSLATLTHLLAHFVKAGVQPPVATPDTEYTLYALSKSGLPARPGVARAARKEETAAIIRILTALGVRTDVRFDLGETCLHWAAQGMTYALEPLIECGADLEARNAAGATPLHEAVLAKCWPNVATLLLAGADRGAKDAAGYTPLELSAAALMDPVVLPRPVKIL